MAVTEVAEHDAVFESPKASRAARLPGAAWTSPAQVVRSLPMVRLLAEIWSVPEVAKIGLHLDEEGIHVRVLMAEDARDARARVIMAERDYLIATEPHGFDLHLTPMAKAGPEMPAPFETVLDR